MSQYTDLDGLGGSGEIVFGCDLVGSTDTCQIVVGLQGRTVSNNAPTDGQILSWSAGAQAWIPSDGPSGTFSAGGDLSGTSTNQTVIRIQTVNVSSTAPTDLQVLQYNNSNSRWEPTTLTFSGDLSGDYATITVAKINGTSVPVAHNTNEVLVSTSPTSAVWSQIYDGYIASGAAISYSKLNLTNSIVNADVNSAAAIAYSKLNLSNSIVNADVNSAAAIAYSKLNLSNSIVNADINASAAIAYSKLNLSGSIVNADISSSAAIAVSKLAAGTAAQILLNNSTPTPTWTTVGGDVIIGNTGSVTVNNLQGSILSAPVSSGSANKVLHGDSSGTLNWSKVDLTTDVTGVLPTGNQANQTMAGDVTGTTAASTVVKLRGKSLNSTLASLDITNDGYVLTWDGVDGYWYATQPSLTSVNTIGTIDSQTKSSNGLVINGHYLYAQTADSSFPGLVSTGTQTFAGNKTLSGTTTLSALGLGVIHSSSGGVLSSSNIVNADVDAAAAIAYSKLNLSNSIVNADINSSAAIAYSKLSLSNSIVNADVNSSAAIAYSKLALSNSIVNADINSSAAIAYSKLNLSGSIVDADVNASAAIAGSKITPNFGTQALTAGTSALGTTTSANSIVGSLTLTTKTFSGTGTVDTTTKDLIIYADTSGGAFTLTLPAPTNGRTLIIKDKKQSFLTNNLTIARNGTEKIDGVAASLVLNLNNQEIILTSDGTDWYTQGSAGAVGTAGGDLSGTYPNPTVAKINGTSVDAAPNADEVLVATSSTVSDWKKIVNANVDSAAAIAYSKLNLSGSIVNADVNASAAIAYSKLNLSGSIVNADVNASAAIAYSKLNLSGSIVNADISSSAAIAVSKLAAGTSAQILMNNGTPTPTWTTISGDVSTTNAGATTVVAVRNNAYKAETPSSAQDGYVPTWVNANNRFEILPQTGGGGSGFSAGGDLSGSASSQQVIAITGASGSVPISSNGNILTWAAATTAPGITQTTITSGNAANMTIEAQGATGASHNGGDLILASGNSGSATGGNIKLKVNGSSGTTILSSNYLGQVTGGGLSWTFTNIPINLQGSSNITVNSGASVVHTDSGGVFTYSLISDADVSSSAAIAVSKLAAGTNTYVLTTVAGVPTWSAPASGFTAGGDLSGTSSSQTVIGLQGKSLDSALSSIGATQDGYVLTWVNGDSKWEAQPPLSTFYHVTPAVTVNYTILANDEIIKIGTLTSSITLTLPSSPNTGQTHIIKNGNNMQFVRNASGTITTVGYTVTVTPASGNIDGLANYVINQPYQALEIVYTGSEWSII